MVFQVVSGKETSCRPLLNASQVGQDVVISTGSDSPTLKNATLSGLDRYDFHLT